MPTANQVGALNHEDSFHEEEEDILNQIFSIDMITATKPHDNINKKKKGGSLKHGGLFFDALTSGANMENTVDRRPIRMKDVDFRKGI